MSDRGKPVKLSDHLYLFRDTCNAFVVTKGKRALVIDCGAGEVRKHLRGMGVEKVDWLLFTHHHRDQCQGAEQLVRTGAAVAAPEYEAFLFENAAEYMRNRWVYDSYNDRATANTRLADLPLKQVLEDYDTFRWQGYNFEIIPTPGHTLGSSTLLARIDGRTVAFTGDLLREEGRFHTLHDLEYSYGGCEGADLAAYSAMRLRTRNLDLICPSHGDLIEEPAEALDALFENARAWFRWKTGSELPCMHRPVPVSDHLVAFPSSCCSWYALIGNDGRAMFIDHGTHDTPHFTAASAHREWWETLRYVDHGIDYLRERHGLRSVAVLMPTHHHDDHVAGFWYLQKHHGAEVWCVEQMKDILEHPESYAEMCLFPKPVKVDRTFTDGQTFRWNGYEFQVWHYPGQTEYHQLILLNVDGREVLFTGDSVHRELEHVTSPVIFRNYHRFESHAECAEKLQALRPSLVAPGHGEVWAPRWDEFATFRHRTQQLHTLYRRLLPEDERWQGINPFWARIMPYQITIKRGKRAKITVRVVNSADARTSAVIEMAGPKGISFEPQSREVRIQAGATREVRFEVRVSQRYKGLPRVAIAADVTIGDRRHGQVAEAFLSIEM